MVQTLMFTTEHHKPIGKHFISVPYVPQSSNDNKIHNLMGESLFTKCKSFKTLLEMGE